MELVLNVIYDVGLRDYLLSQDGIINVDMVEERFLTRLNIEFDDRVNYEMILKYIEIYLNYKYPLTVSFDKKKKKNYKTLKYIIDDICCEYCYEQLVYSLFNNQLIKSVKSNFDFDISVFNVEFIIEYDEKISEEDVIKFIQENE